MSINIERNFGERETYADILSPKGADGEVNYDLLGKILTAKSLEEVLCASYVDIKYGVKLEVPGVPDTDWRYITEEDGVVILRKYNAATRINCFMGRGVVNAPMEKVQTYLADFTTRREYDPMCMDVKVVKQLSDTDVIVYLEHRVQKFWGLFKQKRDSCFFTRQIYVNHSGSESERKYVQTSLSVEHELCPERADCIRMELLPGTGWVLEPYRPSASAPIDPSKTLVNYLAHINCRGLRPTILVNKILQRQPLVVARLRCIFDKLHESGQYTLAAGSGLPSPMHDCSEDQCCEDSTAGYCSHFPTAPMCRDAGLSLAESDIAGEYWRAQDGVTSNRNQVFFISASSSGASPEPTQTSDMLSTCENPELGPRPVQQQRSLLERIGSWFQVPKLNRSQSVPTDEDRHVGVFRSTLPDALAQSEVQLPPVAQEYTSQGSRTTGDMGFSSEEEAHGVIEGQSPSHDLQSAYSPEELATHECSHERGELCDSCGS